MLNCRHKALAILHHGLATFTTDMQLRSLFRCTAQIIIDHSCTESGTFLRDRLHSSHETFIGLRSRPLDPPWPAPYGHRTRQKQSSR